MVRTATDEPSRDARRTPPPDDPLHPARAHRPTGASLIAVLGASAAFVGIMVLHAVRSDVDPLREVMSNYANGSQGPVMSIVFYAFGAAALGVGIRLRTAVDHRGVTRAFPALLCVSGVALIAAGVFEIDRPLAPHTIKETIHSNAAVAAFVMLIVAMLLFSLACWGDGRWRSVRWPSLALAVTAASAAAGTQLAAGSSWSGAAQRMLGGAVLLWFLLTATHVRRKAFRAT